MTADPNRTILTGENPFIRQFLSESTLVAAIAVVLAVGVTLLVLPAFSELAARDLVVGDAHAIAPRLPPLEELFAGLRIDALRPLSRLKLSIDGPPDLHDAVVATEDKRFYWHFGISPRGIASAIRTRRVPRPIPWSAGSTDSIARCALSPLISSRTAATIP